MKSFNGTSFVSALILASLATSANALASTPDAVDAEKADYLTNHVRPDTIRRSFHAAEGMWVDCVDVNLQPSMLTPDMAGRAIEQPPPRADDPSLTSKGPMDGQAARLDTLLHANELDENGVVRHCEEGTIPIRRRTAEDLARFASVQDMFAKGTGHPFARSGGGGGGDTPSPNFYEHSGSAQTVNNWGLQFFMNIWTPFTNAGDHSISQMWIVNGDDTAEGGWTVDPGQFGDHKTHLFIYWTDNDYNTKGVSGNAGCYDLDCPGFVQTSSSVTLGGAYATSSSDDGEQYWDELAWEKSSATANWVLYYNGTALGYIPASKYTHGMQTEGVQVQFGGEVNSPNNPAGSTHTTTQMGSGKFASAGCGDAAFQMHVQYISTGYYTVDVNPPLTIQDTNASCYDYSTGYEKTANASSCTWQTQSVYDNGYFQYFGGPGYSSSCKTTPTGD